jgi:hypothetical protein
MPWHADLKLDYTLESQRTFKEATAPQNDLVDVMINWGQININFPSLPPSALFWPQNEVTILPAGSVAEWSIAPVLKTGGSKGSVSSNLTASAKKPKSR